MDTMFVDEGFGSLDEDSLQQAMKALTGLAKSNRLVGIISHVAELKERIDRQIVVTKERSGGSRVQIHSVSRGSAIMLSEKTKPQRKRSNEVKKGVLPCLLESFR